MVLGLMASLSSMGLLLLESGISAQSEVPSINQFELAPTLSRPCIKPTPTAASTADGFSGQRSGHSVACKAPTAQPAHWRRPNKNWPLTMLDASYLWLYKLNQFMVDQNVLPGIELFSRGATTQLSSPLLRFTTEFGMDRCGTTAPWTPG